MPKLCAGPRVFPRRRKTSHLFNERPAVDSDYIAVLDVQGAVVHTDVGVDPVTRIDMKAEAASVGGLFTLWKPRSPMMFVLQASA